MTILILGGTTEAADLARRLADLTPPPRAIYSLAGRTARPAPAAIPMRIGGFGGADGLAAYLKTQGIRALVDATHPFAAIMPFNAAAACARAGVPRVVMQRPGWREQPGDDWRRVPDMAAAVAALGETSRRVFLTIGRLELTPFAAAPWHDYLVRSIDPVEDPPALPRITLMQARGPFDDEAEEKLMRRERVEILVTKDAGGTATAGKLEAARRLGLPVVMVDRPLKPAGERVATVEEALAWLGRHGVLPYERGV